MSTSDLVVLLKTENTSALHNSPQSRNRINQLTNEDLDDTSLYETPMQTMITQFDEIDDIEKEIRDSVNFRLLNERKMETKKHPINHKHLAKQNSPIIQNRNTKASKKHSTNSTNERSVPNARGIMGNSTEERFSSESDRSDSFVEEKEIEEMEEKNNWPFVIPNISIKTKDLKNYNRSTQDLTITPFSLIEKRRSKTNFGRPHNPIPKDPQISLLTLSNQKNKISLLEKKENKRGSLSYNLTNREITKTENVSIPKLELYPKIIPQLNHSKSEKFKFYSERTRSLSRSNEYENALQKARKLSEIMVKPNEETSDKQNLNKITQMSREIKLLKDELERIQHSHTIEIQQHLKENKALLLEKDQLYKEKESLQHVIASLEKDKKALDEFAQNEKLIKAEEDCKKIENYEAKISQFLQKLEKLEGELKKEKKDKNKLQNALDKYLKNESLEDPPLINSYFEKQRSLKENVDANNLIGIAQKLEIENYYIPVSNDRADFLLSKYLQACKTISNQRLIREKPGFYSIGSKKIQAQIEKEKLRLRIRSEGKGKVGFSQNRDFASFEQFLEEFMIDSISPNKARNSNKGSPTKPPLIRAIPYSKSIRNKQSSYQTNLQYKSRNLPVRKISMNSPKYSNQGTFTQSSTPTLRFPSRSFSPNHNAINSKIPLFGRK